VPPAQLAPHAVIDPLALRAAKARVLARCGVFRIMEAQVHPLVMAIPRFIQIGIPLPSLKPMAQSRRGAHRVMKAQVGITS
jgi:hypothetical protein